jgi:plastocyanin
LAIFAACVSRISAQTTVAPVQQAEVVARLAPAQRGTENKAKNTPLAVIWLNPLHAVAAPPSAPGSYTLLQKNKMFTPHLLVVPVGSRVAFPNADPFFHNVFSLFDGRRFDLGLYEAGSTRSVVFSREGVSYIFCNIHSDMSAVVIALATPYYGQADLHGAFHIKDVPEGDYELHVWIEGEGQSARYRLTRRVHIAGEVTDIGDIRSDLSILPPHLNKFGRPYEPDTPPIY